MGETIRATSLWLWSEAVGPIVRRQTFAMLAVVVLSSTRGAWLQWKTLLEGERKSEDWLRSGPRSRVVSIGGHV